VATTCDPKIRATTLYRFGKGWISGVSTDEVAFSRIPKTSGFGCETDNSHTPESMSSGLRGGRGFGMPKGKVLSEIADSCELACCCQLR